MRVFPPWMGSSFKIKKMQSTYPLVIIKGKYSTECSCFVHGIPLGLQCCFRALFVLFLAPGRTKTRVVLDWHCQPLWFCLFQSADMSPAGSTSSLPISPLPEEPAFFKVHLLTVLIGAVFEFCVIVLSGIPWSAPFSLNYCGISRCSYICTVQFSRSA